MEIHASLMIKQELTKKKLKKKLSTQSKKKVPKLLSNEIKELFLEYEDNKTREAQFVKAIDKLEPIIHNLSHPKLWKDHKVTEKILRDKKEEAISKFPQILEVFEELVDILKNENYFA